MRELYEKSIKILLTCQSVYGKLNSPNYETEKYHGT